MKKGGTVFLVNSDNRIKPVTVTIKSIGSKYITVEGIHKDYSRIDINTHETTNDSGSTYTMFESEEAYWNHIQDEELKRVLRREIKDKIAKADRQTLSKILGLL